MYKLTKFNSIHRLSDDTFLPMTEESQGYVEYLAWRADGNTPEPADDLEPTPSQKAKSALEALERETMMNKGMREFFMVSMQDIATRQSEQMAEHGIEMSPRDILAGRPAWVKLVKINEQALALEKEAGL